MRVRRHRGVAITVALSGAVVLAACSTATSPTVGPVGGHSTTITLSTVVASSQYHNGNYFFNPNPDTVVAASNVTFSIGSVAHSVHFDTGPAILDSIPASVNSNTVRTFATAGTYTFHCSIHGFYGTLVAK